MCAGLWFGGNGGVAFGRRQVRQVRGKVGVVLRTSDLDYELPEGAIATSPAEPRESARLLVVRRSDPRSVEHAHIRDLPRWLQAGDLLVVNSTRVLPARFEGVRIDTGGQVEGLYLQPGPGMSGGEQRTWIVLLSGRRMREGVRLRLWRRTTGAAPEPAQDSGLRLHLLAPVQGEGGAWVVALETEDGTPAPSDVDALERVGLTPLPPYIRAARKRHTIAIDEQYDRARYQTVYAKDARAQVLGAEIASADVSGSGTAPEVGVPNTGSVAAPTAGLHLTPTLFDVLAAQGVRRAEVLLHVGLGTFKGVESEFVEQHPMHRERCSMDAAVMAQICELRSGASGRVVCVGTTAARTVESYARAAEHGEAPPAWLDTNLLITPGTHWRWTDGLLTNFHLPRSTLMAMVSSLLQDPTTNSPAAVRSAGHTTIAEGVRRLKELYALALSKGYRFYSYGDAMLILP